MQPNNRPVIIGVTGNIGSGKSTLCNALADKGFSVYSADLLARQRLEDAEVIKSLVARFSSSILEDSLDKGVFRQTINRAKLAEIVFNDQNKLHYLNSLIHPLVLQDMEEIITSSSESHLIFEVPLIFEADLRDCFDYIILVYASDDLRRRRLEARRGEGEAKRAGFQINDAKKMEAADMLVDNSGSEAELVAKSHALAQILLTIPQRRTKPFWQ